MTRQKIQQTKTNQKRTKRQIKWGKKCDFITAKALVTYRLHTCTKKSYTHKNTHTQRALKQSITRQKPDGKMDKGHNHAVHREGNTNAY